MNNLSLAIGVSSKDIVLTQENFECIDIGELVSKAISQGVKPSKMELIVDFLKSRCSNVLLGYAINNQDDYIQLKKALIGSDYNIKEAFLKKSITSGNYEESYRKHSNWMDYSPEYIKSKEEHYNKETQQILNVLSEDGVYVHFVA